MFGSSSNFFHQSKEVLDEKHEVLANYLVNVMNTDVLTMSVYSSAYKYFTNYPDSYDGSTIVKDLNTIPGLDITAMLHDYLYVNHVVATNWSYKLKADYIYAKEMERLGQGLVPTWGRYIALVTLGQLFFIPISLITKDRRMNDSDKLVIDALYCRLKKNNVVT